MSDVAAGDAEAFGNDGFTEQQVDTLARVVVQLRREWRAERDAALAERDACIARLEGKIEALIALVGKRPSKRNRKRSNAAQQPTP